MPLSMRRATAAIKRTNETLEARIKKRENALKLLDKGHTLRAVIGATGISMGTAIRLKDLLNRHRETKKESSPDFKALALVKPPGRDTTLSREEEHEIVKQLINVARRGFAASMNDLKVIAADIANRVFKPFKNGQPSDAWVCSFRSRHRNLTYRRYERKEFVKIAAECSDHLQSYQRALRQVEKKHPGILSDPKRIWNMDETDVRTELGERVKVFGSARNNHGGYKGTKAHGNGKHLTAFVMANAAGDRLPPFFIFAGKHQMKRWFEPLPSAVFKDDFGIAHWLTQANWMPENSFICPSLNGSMQIDIIHFVLDHIDKNVRKSIPRSCALLLILDGHKSRSGYDWLLRGREYNIEIIQAPANTSHFLQPCDNKIKKTFNQTVRRMRDWIERIAPIDFSDMRLKLMLGVAGFKSLTGEVIRSSFHATGIWPMDFRFVNGPEMTADDVADRLSRSEKRKNKKDLADIIAVLNREDSDTLDKIEGVKLVLERESKIQNIVHTTVEARQTVVQEKRKSREVIAIGTPAVYLTHDEVLNARKLVVEKKQREAEEKEKKNKRERKRRLKGKKWIDELHQKNLGKLLLGLTSRIRSYLERW